MGVLQTLLHKSLLRQNHFCTNPLHHSQIYTNAPDQSLFWDSCSDRSVSVSHMPYNVEKNFMDYIDCGQSRYQDCNHLIFIGLE